MKICIITSKFPPIIGGGETYVYQLAICLHDKGHEVTVITNKNYLISKVKYPFKIIEINNFYEEHPDLIAAIPSLFVALSSLSPDIIHIHNYIPYFIFCSTGYSSKAKVVLSIHNTPDFPKRVFGNFKNFQSEASFCQNIYKHHKPDLIIVGSKYYSDSIKFLIKKPTKIKVLPFGVDEKIFYKCPIKKQIPELINKSKQDKIIICPSRLIKRKGISELIKSLTFLPEKYKLFLPTAHTPVSMNYFAYLNNLIKKLNLQKRIIMGQHQYQYCDMPNIYNSCDIFIMPSYYEGFGIAIIEAMSTGIPVITTCVPGINEIAINEYNALVVDPKKPKLLAQSIYKLENDNSLKIKIINNAHKTINKKFTLDNHINILLKYYKSLL